MVAFNVTFLFTTDFNTVTTLLIITEHSNLILSKNISTIVISI